MTLLLLFVVCVVVQCIDAAKILAIFPFAGPSHYFLVQPYLKELAKAGHQLTVINAFPQKETIENFRDVPALKIHEIHENFLGNLTIVVSKWTELKDYGKYFSRVNAFVFECDEVQKLLHSNETFDLVIAETLMNEPLYGFAQHFNAILMGVSSYGTDRNIDELVSNMSPMSYLPQKENGFTEHMSFSQRLQNLIHVTLEWIYLRIIFYPEQETLYKKNFPNAKVSMMEMRRNFSIILLNQHFSFGTARPYVPNMIQVGGFHIQHKPAALPQEMEDFINAYSAGIVYFSLGSNIKSKNLPAHVIDVILQTFAQLKQGVMWKFEGTELPNKPSNVFISKWFPQSDLLAHPNVKLFITHGGLLSTIEAVYYGKPVLGVPIFYDQFNNVGRAVESGYCLRLDIFTMTIVEFKTAIERLLTEPSFTKTAKQLMKLYHDQPITPMETAIYWTEYVLRHKGATHMRVAAHNLNFFQLHSLDTIAVLYGGILLCLIAIFQTIRKAICLVLRQSKRITKQKFN